MPVEYFPVVFTIPEQIAAIAFRDKSVVYDILFRVTAQTLLTIAQDPKHLGADIGFFCVLHTWGQSLHHILSRRLFLEVWRKLSNTTASSSSPA